MSDSQKIAKRARARGERVSGKIIQERVAQSRMDRAMSRAMPQRIAGRGNYFTKAARYVDNHVLKKIPRGTFKSIGGAIGGMPGAALGNAISELSGRGDYAIQKNSIMDGVDQCSAGAMSFAPSGAARVRVQKREFVANIVAPDLPTEFNQQQFRLQATNTATFPWMAGIAYHFTEWELHGCVFTFESTSSNYSNSMALGTLAMATQYNSNEAPYANMEQVLSAAYNSRCNPSESMMHGIECDPSLQASEHLYTRRLGSLGPPNLYDHGVLTIATQGLPAPPGTVLGRLYVNYDIELNIPALPTTSPYIGSAMTILMTAPSPADAPMGSLNTLPSASALPGLNFARTPGEGVNVLYAGINSGPVVRPTLPPSQSQALVAWLTDSTLQGSQWLSFTNPGTYTLELSVGVSGQPSNLFTCTSVSTDVSITSTFLGLGWLTGGTGSYYRFEIKCKSINQSILLQRQSPDNAITMSVLTVCDTSMSQN
jgi:hypothetical protein